MHISQNICFIRYFCYSWVLRHQTVLRFSSELVMSVVSLFIVLSFQWFFSICTLYLIKKCQDTLPSSILCLFCFFHLTWSQHQGCQSSRNIWTMFRDTWCDSWCCPLQGQELDLTQSHSVVLAKSFLYFFQT